MKKSVDSILIVVILITSLVNCQSPDDHKTKKPVSFHVHGEELTISHLHQWYEDGEVSIESVVSHYLKRIEAIDNNGPQLNAIITTNPNAIVEAQWLDKEWKEGKRRSALHGIPIVLKDNIDTYDMPTTAGSRALGESIPPHDSYLVQRLREAGAIILGKANLSEWANFRGQRSSSGWSGVGGQTRNPYKLDHNPCGSSSGSAVAVAANLCVIAIGTETNGSIVCPSHANGVVGLKPTVGLISRSGIIPISWTQDTAGPIGRSVRDVATSLGPLVSIDSSDAKMLVEDRKYFDDYTQFLSSTNLTGKRIGLDTDALGVDAATDSLTRIAVKTFKSLGAEIIEVNNILSQETENASFEVMLQEYRDGLNRYFASLGPEAPIKSLRDVIAYNESDSIEMAFYGQEYLELALEKEGMSSEAYHQVVEVAITGARDNGIDRVMDQHRLNAIIAPTGTPAWKTNHDTGDTYILGTSSPAAISGYPNLSVPMGYIDGLPVGLSIYGRAWSEGVLLDIGHVYEQQTRHRQRPKYIPEGE